MQSDIDSKADETDLAGKANTADVYTKTEVDDLVSSAGGDATGVEYSSISTVQNYVSLSSANTSVQSITVSCPEDGYIVVSGNASVMYVTGASASLVSIQCKVTLNTTTLSGACSQVNFAPSPSDMENITFIGGYQVSQGTHTLRLLLTPSEGSYYVYSPTITCVFSPNKL